MDYVNAIFAPFNINNDSLSSFLKVKKRQKKKEKMIVL